VTYTATGNPGNKSPGASASIRSEFVLIAAALANLPEAGTLGSGAIPVSNGSTFVPASAINGLPVGNIVASSGAFTTLNATGAVAFAGGATLATANFTNIEATRLVNNSGFLSCYNTNNSQRTGYLQFNSGGVVVLKAEAPAATGVALSTTGGQLQISQLGVATFSGPVVAASFNGFLGTANISQFTNDVGYVTSVGAAAAGSLTGSTLAAGVTASSLTSLGTLSILNVGGGAGFAQTALFAAAEAIRFANSAAYIAGHNTANTARTGYLQFNAGASVVLQAEAAATSGVAISTVGGGLQINQLGTSTFSGAVTGTSFNGKLQTANVSQWANDSGYLTAMGNAPSVTMAANRTDGAAYPIVWGTAGATSQMYSCAAVTITSSTGTINTTNLVATGDVTSTSDRRFKTALRVIEDALGKVRQLNGYTFARTDDENPDRRHTGLIAQELQKVLPEAVVESKLGLLSVAYGNTVGLLVEAIKALDVEVQSLKAAQ
jgi:hypothetical protein